MGTALPTLCTVHPTHDPVDSDWSEGDWDGDKAREKKNRKEEEMKHKLAVEEYQTKAITTYYPQVHSTYQIMKNPHTLARDLIPRQAQENITSNSRKEDKKKKKEEQC